MKLLSSDFENEQKIPSKFTCDGEDLHPNLEITEVPEGAQSLAILIDDPDSPSGTWTHWLCWNIDPGTKVIRQGEIPQGAVEGKNSADEIGYYGPCPANGNHRYFFYLYALNTKLDIPQDIAKSEFEIEVKKYFIEKTKLMGTYQRTT